MDGWVGGWADGCVDGCASCWGGWCEADKGEALQLVYGREQRPAAAAARAESDAAGRLALAIAC